MKSLGSESGSELYSRNCSCLAKLLKELQLLKGDATQAKLHSLDEFVVSYSRQLFSMIIQMMIVSHSAKQQQKVLVIVVVVLCTYVRMYVAFHVRMYV